jgi:predicted HicB family RNase H-like nuclease
MRNSVRLTVVVDEDLHIRCKKDAEQMHLSLSAYIASVLKERHGLLKIMVSAPGVSRGTD